jgi:hypothetical protein
MYIGSDQTTRLRRKMVIKDIIDFILINIEYIKKQPKDRRELDLLIDDCIIEIKTNSVEIATISNISQTLLYGYLLHKKKKKINKIILYNPLSGEITEFDTSNLVFKDIATKYYGEFNDNFKRGRGDYMGLAGSLNDGSDITAPVGTFPPNDFGLYNMAGNVSEWVQDVYRPLSHEDVADFSPFRGNVFTTPVLDEEGNLAEKDSLGKIRYREITVNEAVTRTNYREANNINYLDGDNRSVLERGQWQSTTNNQTSTKKMYDYGQNSLINDQSRVYKGGSWRDGTYFLSPGTRRYFDENEATNYIGFRCAMDRVGGAMPK